LFWVDQSGPLFNQRLIERAEAMLKEHGFGLDCWPSRTRTAFSAIQFNGLLERRDYDFLIAKASDVLPKGQATRYLRIFFGQYRGFSNGVTVWSTERVCLTQPICLVDPGVSGDNVTLLHEVGHAAGLDHETFSTDPMNRSFMNEANTRTRMFRFQVDKLAQAFFAK
jgi:hypothetical protein